jgi:hypothetical protein
MGIDFLDAGSKMLDAGLKEGGTKRRKDEKRDWENGRMGEKRFVICES